MTEENKKRMKMINKKISSMSWNTFISKQIERGDENKKNWECDRWLKSIDIENDLEMELIYSIIESLIPS